MARIEGPLKVLRYRNFRLFWLGFIISNAGSWIQSVAQAWLVYEISGSAVWLGAIGFVRAFPIVLLALVGGTVADRFPRRTILYITQGVMAFVALSLGTLTYLGVVQVWHVLALTSLSAVAQAFDQPARQALVPSLVEKPMLHAAISLNAIAFNGATVLGPSLTGLLVPWVGLAGCFFVNALSFLSVFYVLARIEFSPTPGTGPERVGMIADLRAGLQHVRSQPLILAVISMAGATSFFARPYNQFLTVFAADVFHGGVGTAGLMQSAPGVGTVIFMLIIVSLGEIRWKGKLLLAAGLGFGLAMIAFAWMPNFTVAMLLLVLVGGFNMTWMTTVNTLLQELVDDSMRGRVMATYTITAMAMTPMGQGPMGWTMEKFGPQWAFTLGAIVSMAWIVYMGFIRVKMVRALP